MAVLGSLGALLVLFALVGVWYMVNAGWMCVCCQLCCWVRGVGCLSFGYSCGGECGCS